jgi:hypothetical protein
MCLPTPSSLHSVNASCACRPPAACTQLMPHVPADPSSLHSVNASCACRPPAAYTQLIPHVPADPQQFALSSQYVTRVACSSVHLSTQWRHLQVSYHFLHKPQIISNDFPFNVSELLKTLEEKKQRSSVDTVTRLRARGLGVHIRGEANYFSLF